MQQCADAIQWPKTEWTFVIQWNPLHDGTKLPHGFTTDFLRTTRSRCFIQRRPPALTIPGQPVKSDPERNFENSGTCQATNTMGSFLSTTASTSSLCFWLRISDLFMNKMYHIILKLMKRLIAGQSAHWWKSLPWCWRWLTAQWAVARSTRWVHRECARGGCWRCCRGVLW